jgi:hypothetical protein
VLHSHSMSFSVTSLATEAVNNSARGAETGGITGSEFNLDKSFDELRPLGAC